VIKSRIRNKIIKLRKNNSYQNLRIVSEKFSSFLKNKKYNFKNLGGYYPSNYEIDDLHILDIYNKKDYNILLPAIKKNNQMDFFKWSNNAPLRINKYGIPEPVSSKVFYPDILLVPLVGYDSDLNRLGYGVDFMIAILKKLKKSKKLLRLVLHFHIKK